MIGRVGIVLHERIRLRDNSDDRIAIFVYLITY